MPVLRGRLRRSWFGVTHGIGGGAVCTPQIGDVENRGEGGKSCSNSDLHTCIFTVIDISHFHAWLHCSRTGESLARDHFLDLLRVQCLVLDESSCETRKFGLVFPQNIPSVLVSDLLVFQRRSPQLSSLPPDTQDAHLENVLHLLVNLLLLGRRRTSMRISAVIRDQADLVAHAELLHHQPGGVGRFLEIISSTCSNQKSLKFEARR